MRTRPFGVAALAALVVTALVAVWTLLFSAFDETAGKILGTSASVAGYSLLVMGAATGFGKDSSNLRRALATAAVATTVAAFVGLMLLIWVRWSNEETAGKAFASLAVVSSALVVVVLLGRLREPAHVVLLRNVASALVLAFAVAGDYVWFVAEIRSEAVGRGLGVLGVLAALGVLVAPLAAWQNRRSADAAAPGREIACPRCGHRFAP